MGGYMYVQALCAVAGLQHLEAANGSNRAPSLSMRRQVSGLFQRRLPDQLQVGQMLQGPKLGIANSSCKAELKTKLAATLKNVALPDTRKLPIELKKAWDKLKASGPGKLKNTVVDLASLLNKISPGSSRQALHRPTPSFFLVLLPPVLTPPAFCP